MCPCVYVSAMETPTPRLLPARRLPPLSNSTTPPSFQTRKDWERKCVECVYLRFLQPLQQWFGVAWKHHSDAGTSKVKTHWSIGRRRCAVIVCDPVSVCTVRRVRSRCYSQFWLRVAPGAPERRYEHPFCTTKVVAGTRDRPSSVADTESADCRDESPLKSSCEGRSSTFILWPAGPVLLSGNHGNTWFHPSNKSVWNHHCNPTVPGWIVIPKTK